HVDAVHEIQEMPGIDPVIHHQALQGRGVLPEILLLQGARGLPVEIQQLLNIKTDSPLDLIEQPTLGRVEGVVEVEYPKLDMGKIDLRHGPGFSKKLGANPNEISGLPREWAGHYGRPAWGATLQFG